MAPQHQYIQPRWYCNIKTLAQVVLHHHYFLPRWYCIINTSSQMYCNINTSSPGCTASSIPQPRLYSIISTSNPGGTASIHLVQVLQHQYIQPRWYSINTSSPGCTTSSIHLAQVVLMHSTTAERSAHDRERPGSILGGKRCVFTNLVHLLSLLTQQ